MDVLHNIVEQQVAHEAANAFALSNEAAIQEYCGQTHHAHIKSSMRAYVSVGQPISSAIDLFWNAVADYLPPDPLNPGSIKLARGSLRHYSCSASQWSPPNTGWEAEEKWARNISNLGWHLFLYTTPMNRKGLLYDGTDERFIPGPAGIWRHRLWAGGSIDLHPTLAKDTFSHRSQHIVERPVELRIVGANQVPEKLFVTVSKRLYSIEGRARRDGYNVPGLLQWLSDDFVKSDLPTALFGPYLEEKYTLCFLRNPPRLSNEGVASRVIAPPRQPRFSHTLTPDRHLLFWWSSLSYNAHLIHLDKSFARDEYGAKDLVVHGPLTLMLVLEWFHRQITRYVLDRELPRFDLVSIDYKCLAPLFVDEPMTLCTKPTKFPTPGTLAESWEVWVQKDVGEGVQSMAFKGTIKLRTEIQSKAESEQQKRSRFGDATDDDTDPVAAAEDAPGNEFRSPFFS